MNQSFAQTTLISYAKRYLSFGWSLIPILVTNSEKKPAIAWKEFQERRPSEQELETWIQRGWGLGLVTGSISNIVVIDDDRPKYNLSPFDAESPIIALTKNGGRHLYFRATKDIRNTQNREFHVDVRGEGGFVVLPPFFEYTWLEDAMPTADHRASLQPLSLTTYNSIKQSTTYKPAFTIDDVLQRVDGEGRHDALHRFGCSLWRNKRNTPEQILTSLRIAAQSMKPPLPEKDVQRTFENSRKFISTEEAKQFEKTEVFSPRVKYSDMDETQLKQIKIRDSIPLGIPRLDEKFAFPSGYYVICAQPGSGKGFFATWLARRAYERHKERTVFFSLEMSEPLVRQRLLQQWSDLTYGEFSDGSSTKKAMDLLREDCFVLVDFAQAEAKMSPEQFILDVKRHHNEGYRIFMFDHLHEITGAIANDTNQKVVEEWGKAFQTVCKDFPDIWLFVFAQPNAASQAKKFLTKNDLLGSKSIAQKCEFFISLNREQEKDEATGVLIVNQTNRKVLFFLDKNRITPEQGFGIEMYFAPTGNFFVDESDYEKQRPKTFTFEQMDDELLKNVGDLVF